MCGEIETGDSIAEEFYARFADNARAFLAAIGDGGSANADDPLYRYLDKLFRETLAAAADPDTTPEDISGFDRFCMESLVYARIAGFMAAHQPLEDDPMRRLMEAVMMGYAEGEEAIENGANQEAHAHSHAHGHTH